MRILVVGAGAVGGFVAARLADAGEDVTVLVRERWVAPLRERGIVVRDGSGERATPVTVVSAPLSGPLPEPYDAVVVAVKAGGLRAVLDDVAAAVAPGGLVVPFLNGMGHLPLLVDRLGDAVVGGVVRVATEREDDGGIRLLAPMFDVEIGELSGHASPRVDALVAAFGRAGAQAEARGDITAAMWAKWVFIASLGASTVLMRAPVGAIVARPGGDAFARAVLDEAAAVAAAAGYPVDGGALAANEKVVTTPGSSLTSSLSRDLVAGRPVEVDAVLGDLVDRAGVRQVPVPLLAAAALALRVHNASLPARR